MRPRSQRFSPRRRSSTSRGQSYGRPDTTCPIRTGRSRTRTCRRRSALPLPRASCSSSDGSGQRAAPPLARALGVRLPAARRRDERAGALGGPARPRRPRGRDLVPPRCPSGRGLRAREADRARPGARQRVRPARDRDLGPRAARPRGLRAGGRRPDGRRERPPGGLDLGVARGRAAGRPAGAAGAEGRLDRPAARLMATHELPLERRTLHGHFSRDLPPVLEIDSGDTVRISTPNAGWWLSAEERFEPRDETLDAGHALAGPIAIRDARAGETLEVRVQEVRPGSWGVTPTREPHLVYWELADGIARGAGVAVELAPFLGVMGMPPPEPGVHSTIPPRRSGGNIDCKELVAGSTLFLPILVEGALFSAGDGHARQGDGEVCGTAIECPSEATLTLSVRDNLPLEWPLARTR